MSNQSTVTLERNSPRLATITFSNPPVNVIIVETVARLGAILGQFEQDSDLQVVVFKSDVPDFLAVAAKHQLIGARVDAPVEVAQVVAGDVGAMIVEFQAGTGASTQACTIANTPTPRVDAQAQTADGGSHGGVIKVRHSLAPCAQRSDHDGFGRLRPQRQQGE